MSSPASASYPQAKGTARGLARREALLAAVTDDLATHGLADFSLRRAARAAGTTHKVLLYHFGDDATLLTEAIGRLRQRRIANALAVSGERAGLAANVAAWWPVLAEDATGLRVIDQAIGLAMYDPDRYAHLAREAAQAYREPLRALCPPGWSEQRTTEVTELVLAAMRGFLMEWRTTGDEASVRAGLAALVRVLEIEDRRPE